MKRTIKQKEDIIIDIRKELNNRIKMLQRKYTEEATRHYWFPFTITLILSILTTFYTYLYKTNFDMSKLTQKDFPKIMQGVDNLIVINIIVFLLCLLIFSFLAISSKRKMIRLFKEIKIEMDNIYNEYFEELENENKKLKQESEPLKCDVVGLRKGLIRYLKDMLKNDFNPIIIDEYNNADCFLLWEVFDFFEEDTKKPFSNKVSKIAPYYDDLFKKINDDNDNIEGIVDDIHNTILSVENLAEKLALIRNDRNDIPQELINTTKKYNAFIDRFKSFISDFRLLKKDFAYKHLDNLLNIDLSDYL